MGIECIFAGETEKEMLRQLWKEEALKIGKHISE